MIQTAIMGYGTVGGGVTKVIENNAGEIRKKLGEALNVKKILVRRFRDCPYRARMTDDFRDIEQDPEIQVVVETIGGLAPAYEYTKRALLAGKHVVTANKQLVAEKGCELMETAREKNVHYLFEASVGGGIPILHPLTECMSANRIQEVYGILNGTSNYILTRMVRNGATFEGALSEAQARGYAEADPTADVDGLDAGRKICILADLAFGHQVNPSDVPAEGIRGITLRDVRIARRGGYRVKLLGRAVRLPKGHTAYVAPHLIPETWPVANVEDVFNAIVVRGNAVGEVMFYGRGAGEMPTASACVADVMECLTSQQQKVIWSPDPAGFRNPAELETRHYFRIDGSLTDAVRAFGEVEALREDDETSFLTERMSGAEASERAGRLRGIGVNVLSRMRALS